MQSIQSPQEAKSSEERQARSEFKRRSEDEVRQDNNAPLRDRTGVFHAYSADKVTHSVTPSKNSDRAKKHSTKRQTEPITTWVRQPIRGDIDQIAREEGLTRSKVASTLLEWAVNERLHRRTAALIPAVIETSVEKCVGARLARTDTLLVQAALDISQTRTLTTNILGRQSGVTAEKLNTILDRSRDKAKDDLTHRSPELEEFIAAVVHAKQPDAERRVGPA